MPQTGNSPGRQTGKALARQAASPHTTRWISFLGNLSGAILAFCYFRFIDYTNVYKVL